jgi:opacity protein-like surface antigen
MKKLLLLVFCLLLAAPSYAILGISVGARGGIATGVDMAVEDDPLLNAAMPGLDLDKMTMIGLQFKFGAIPKIDLVFTGDYYWKTVSLLGNEFKIGNLALTASAVYPIPISFTIISPYAGAGIATHRLAFSGEGFVIPADESKFGYHLIGGINFSPPIIPISINGEIRMNWIKTENETSDFMSFTLGLNLGIL